MVSLRRSRKAPGAVDLPVPALRLRDLLDEAAAGLLARPGRAVLTVLGTVLGVAALVATLGIAKTAGNQIVSQFDAATATEVVVAPRESPREGAASRGLPWNAEQRLTRLNGVRAAGTKSPVDVDGAALSSVPVTDPLGQAASSVSVIAASPGLLDAVGGTVAAGRWYDRGHDQRGDPVAVLGPAAAERLGVQRIDLQPAVFIGDRPFTVIGILGGVARSPDLLNAVILPDGTARAAFDLAAPAAVHVDTELGAAQLIAGQAPLALDPNDPARLKVTAPPDPATLRAAVSGDVDALFLVLGGVALLVGAIGIANVTLVSVLERVGEIGLRRALGASRRHVAAQFLMESVAVGAVGGVLGASIGVLVVVGTAAARTWTPVLDAWVPLGAPVLGAAVGLLAGVYPSLRAASLQPVDALRAGD